MVVVQRQASAPEAWGDMRIGRLPSTESGFHGCDDILSASQRQHEEMGRSTPAATMELKELESLLENFLGKQEHLDAVSLSNLSPDNEPRNAPRVQLVQRALSVAPDSKVRELCAILACQQVEQDMTLHTLQASVTQLQRQVQILLHSTGVSQNADDEDSNPEQPLMTDPDAWLKGKIETETKKAWDKLEGKLLQQEAQLKQWFAEFCVCAIKETFGDEVNHQATTIRSLDMQVGDLNTATANSMESINFLSKQVNELNAITKLSAASVQQLLNRSVSPAGPEQLVQDNMVLGPPRSAKQRSADELPRQLQTHVRQAILMVLTFSLGSRHCTGM